MADVPCPRCGRPSSGSGVCAACFVADNPIIVKGESFRECGCGLTFFKGRFYDEKEPMFMEFAVKSLVPPAGSRLTVTDVRWDYQGGFAKLDADVDIHYGMARFRHNVKWEVRPERMKCNSCTKLGSGYFEAILQVRDKDVDLGLDEKQVADVEATRGGYDIYLISMDYARERVSSLINRGYLVKQSTKLFGKRNGSDVFRFYYSIKAPDFVVGDFVEYEGILMRVRELGKNVKLIELPTMKNRTVSMHRMAHAVLKAKSSEVRKAIVTGVRPDGIQVMDAEEGRTWEVSPKDGLRHGDDVEYVKINHKIYLL